MSDDKVYSPRWQTFKYSFLSACYFRLSLTKPKTITELVAEDPTMVPTLENQIVTAIDAAQDDTSDVDITPYMTTTDTTTTIEHIGCNLQCLL